MDVELIEKTARAMFDAIYPERDANEIIDDYESLFYREPRWHIFIVPAKQHITAFNTLMGHHSYTLRK